MTSRALTRGQERYQAWLHSEQDIKFGLWLKQGGELEPELGYCPSCSGSGEGMFDGSTCHRCGGCGEDQQKRDYE